MSCECPRHNEHVKNFIRKYPGADGKFGIVSVEPEEWLVNLEHPEKLLSYCIKEVLGDVAHSPACNYHNEYLYTIIHPKLY